jgi:hypothetical protein
MCAFVVLARIRIGNKCLGKKWQQLPMDCMMQQSVPNACLVNVARFRIGNFERLVCGVLVCFGGKIAVQRNNVCHQVSFEFLYVFAGPFAAQKLLPRLE